MGIVGRREGPGSHERLPPRFFQCGASAGHVDVYNVMVMMVGNRRAPGATILGGARSSSSPANHHFCLPRVLRDGPSGTSVPCTRSPESAGHFVENSVMDQMVGSRRSPGATILGASTSTSSANHRLFVPPTGFELRDGFSFRVVLGLRFALPEA